MPAKIYVGIKAAIFQNRKLLVLKREIVPGQSFWDLPGGRLEENEDLMTGLKRELFEELPGLGSYRVGELLGARKNQSRTSDGTELVIIYYQIFTGPFEEKLSSEHTGFKWFGQTEVENLPSPYSETYAKFFELAEL